jgi:hypothetical protein
MIVNDEKTMSMEDAVGVVRLLTRQSYQNFGCCWYFPAFS